MHSNQTAYDDTHVQWVHTFEAAQHAPGVGGALAGTAEPRTRDRIVKLADGSGWHTTAANPGVEVAARTLGAFSTIGFEPSDKYLEAYESAAATIAHAVARPRPARACPCSWLPG